MVLENNVADKRMRTNILHPRIIVVQGSLTLDIIKSSFLDIESILKQEKHFLKSIEKSLSTIRPDVMVVEGEVSRKIVEKLRDINVTVIMNVPIDELKLLAWLTQTITIPSVDFIDEHFKWGTCEEFIVQPQMDDTFYNKNTAHYKTRYSAYFRNCNPALGCTMCISGPNDEELKTVQSCIEDILDACREDLLGNGFEKREFSIGGKRTLHQKKAQNKTRPKTLFVMHKVNSEKYDKSLVLIEEDESERGGFMDAITE